MAREERIQWLSMADNEHINEFNKLVTECASSKGRDEQVSYLTKVVRKVMKKRYGVGKKAPDSINSLEVRTPAQEDMHNAWVILDSFYSDVTKLLLDDPSFDVLDIRTGVIREMQKSLDGNQQGTNV